MQSFVAHKSTLLEQSQLSAMRANANAGMHAFELLKISQS